MADKFAWDPKKHDERRPPPVEHTPIVCAADDCKHDVFVQGIKLYDVKAGETRSLLRLIHAYVCTKCGTPYPVKNPTPV